MPAFCKVLARITSSEALQSTETFKALDNVLHTQKYPVVVVVVKNSGQVETYTKTKPNQTQNPQNPTQNKSNNLTTTTNQKKPSKCSIV